MSRPARPPRTPVITLPSPVASTDVLFIRPNRWRIGGKILEAHAGEKSRMAAMVKRFPGLIRIFTGGMLEVRTHVVDPDILFDVWPVDVPEADIWKPTTENGRYAPSIHEGAAAYFGKPFGIGRYPYRFFLAPYSVFPLDMGDLTWANWSYNPVRASEDYSERVQTETLDVLGHDMVHMTQYLARARKAPFTVPNPDRAGDYGNGPGYSYPDPRLGWMAPLTDWLSGTAKPEPGIQDASVGMTADRWRMLFPERGPSPVVPARYVSVVPETPVRLGEAWTPPIG